MKKTISKILLFLSLTFFAVGAYFVYQGFDKKDNYYQSDYSWSKSVNAYVGGDAYNYIINGTYFAGYCALGGAMFICGSIAGIGGLAITVIENKREEDVPVVSEVTHMTDDNTVLDIESTC